MATEPSTAAPNRESRATRSEIPKSRRRFLKELAAVPFVLGVGAAAAGLGKKAAAGQGPPATPLKGDPDALRQRFLAQAQAARQQGILTDSGAPTNAVALEVVPLSPTAPAAPIEVLPGTDESILIRMQRELQQAMKKPMNQRKWSMVIDLRKCIGCSACTVACKAENHLPPGVVYRPVIDEEIGEYPNVTRRFLPRPCMQCDDPPCVPVCPVDATWKREDGIVVIDYNACIGCRYCLAACPYGARYFDFGEDYSDDTPEKQPYEESPSPEYSREWRRNGNASPVGNARKCQFCIHRLEVGMLPACVTTCVGAATYFGDKNDPESLVNELIASGRAIRLKEELGTDPKVYYLI